MQDRGRTDAGLDDATRRPGCRVGRTASALLLTTGGFLSGGCLSAAESLTTRVVGKLESDVVSPAGEAAWRLITPGLITGRSIPLDVSSVPEEALEARGEFVEVFGELEGAVIPAGSSATVLKVESLRLAPAGF